MGPFYIVVGDVLRHGPSEVLLANRHQPVEIFLLDRDSADSDTQAAAVTVRRSAISAPDGGSGGVAVGRVRRCRNLV